MKVYVVDASVAVKWFVHEDFSDRADALLRDFRDGKVELAAPKSLMQEFCNAMRKYVVRGLVDRKHADKCVEKMSQLPIDFVDIDWSVAKEAYNKALELSITVHDAVYIVVAERLNAAFITSDDRLYNQLRGRVRAEHIRDYRREEGK